MLFPIIIKHSTKNFNNLFVSTFIYKTPPENITKNSWEKLSAIPPNSPESDTMSKNMKKRGFSFVGSTICYAFMQAAGLVNDHTTDCFRYRKVGK